MSGDRSSRLTSNTFDGSFEHNNSLRIFGPPGSGKTRELVRILQEHVADGDFRLPEGIIASFTRAAAHDIARRVNPDGEPGKYHCTLHALCKRYYGFDGEMAEKRVGEFFASRGIEYRRSSGVDPEEWASSQDDDQTAGGMLMGIWSLARNQMVPIESVTRLLTPSPKLARWWPDNGIAHLFKDYQAWKRDSDLYDFTDMLETAVSHPPTAAFPFFVLDEAQDCTPLQWRVANAFARCADLVYLAGDDDQCIYGWIGASPRNFLQANVTAEDILRVNHRSGSALVDEAQQFIRKSGERRDKATVAQRPGGSIETRMAVPLLSLDRPTFVMARAHYMNGVVMDELELRGYPFEDKRKKRGVGGTGAVAYERWRHLKTGAISLDEFRKLLAVIPSDGPWLTRGTKKRFSEMDARFRSDTYIRAKDITTYGGTEQLLAALLTGSSDPLRMDTSRLAYFERVAENFGEGYLDPLKARQVCSVGPIHAFKGLEADTVILGNGISPAATREAMRDREPERRVFYVGMTRAKERLIHLETRTQTRWKDVV